MSFLKDLKKNKNEVNKIECLSDSNEEIEKFADKYASELLMPKYKLKELCNQYKNENGYVNFVYKFIKIHPFGDGNGRVSRALLNWMLRLKNIPPIYIDDKCRNEYYNALSAIDKDGDYIPFILLVEKKL